MSKTEQMAIQELLRYRVDLEANKGNKEQLKLAEKAVKWFVRRYIKTNAVRDLQKVLDTKGKEPGSKCITVPRAALEAPVTVLTFLRIWRWPCIRDDSQLLNELFCNYKLSRVSSANANEEVCINPYHYKLAGIEQPMMRVYAPIGKVKRDTSGNTMSVTPSERSMSYNQAAGYSQFELSGALTPALDSLPDGMYPNTAQAATPVNVELKRLGELSNGSATASQFQQPSNVNPNQGMYSGGTNGAAGVFPYAAQNYAVANSSMFGPAVQQQPISNASINSNAHRYVPNAPTATNFGGFAKPTSPNPMQSPTSTTASPFYPMGAEAVASCASNISMDEDMPMESELKKKHEEPSISSPTVSATQAHGMFPFGANQQAAVNSFNTAAQPAATINYAGALSPNGSHTPFGMPSTPVAYGAPQTPQNGAFAQQTAAGMMSPYAQSHASIASPSAETHTGSMATGNEFVQDTGDDVAYGEVVYVEPTCWCSVQYYEKLNHLGETFHCGQPTLTIDGFCDPNSADRFCLGRISNPNRESDAEHVRRLIQRGVKLYYVAGEMYLENLSENAVFVQSSNMNMRNNWPLCAVCKVSPGETAQLFANQDFASLLAHNVNEGYESVYKLTYMCVIRMSFVKGWGAKYHRQTLSSVPCWVEIRLNGALQWLDRVLRQMGSPGLQTSSIS